MIGTGPAWAITAARRKKGARTDDGWNLAAGVGATAAMVAAGRARATRAGLVG